MLEDKSGPVTSNSWAPDGISLVEDTRSIIIGLEQLRS